LALILNTNTRLFTQPMRSSIVASRFGTSRSTAEAIAGNPNSIVAETRDGVVSADGASGMTSGFAPANAVPANEMVESSMKHPYLTG
jgi:hypothetical protein